MSNLTKNLILWLVIAMVLMAVFNNFAPKNSNTEREVDYSVFLNEVKQGRIEQVTIEGRVLRARSYDGDLIVSYSPGDPELINDLLKAGVAIRAQKEEGPSLLMQIFISWFPLLLLIGVWIFFMRQMQGGGGRGALSFGKSKARLLTEDKNNITFADVAGVDEAKEEVQELVEFLSEPSRFQKLAGRCPRGVLMTGSPGTGKTLLAKAIAGEAKVPFFTISGSDFVEMFVGVGASRVRDMFDQGKKNAPCIIFIDEIDAVGRHRGGRGHSPQGLPGSGWPGRGPRWNRCCLRRRQVFPVERGRMPILPASLGHLSLGSTSRRHSHTDHANGGIQRRPPSPMVLGPTKDSLPRLPQRQARPGADIRCGQGRVWVDPVDLRV